MILSLLTATWHYNLWDELILLQEYKILKDYFWENTKFNIFTYNENSSFLPKNSNINYVTYSPTDMYKKPFSNVKYLLSNIFSIAKSDIVIIGWGWLIYTDEKQVTRAPLFYWKLRVFLAKLFSKKIVWLAVGISFPENKLKDLRFLFSGKKTYVSVRDESSQNLLEKIWINATLLSDPVFSFSTVTSNCSINQEKEFNNTRFPLPREWQEKISELQNDFEIDSEINSEWRLLDCHDFLQKSRNDRKKLVWISLRKWYLLNEMENIKQMILFLSKKWYEIVFLSHSIHQDDILANDYAFVSDIAKTYWIRVTKTMEETLEIYKNLDFIIWMRFHSMILSIIYNIPFIALSYWIKTQELLKTFNHEDFSFDPKNFNFEHFIHKFEQLEKSSETVKFAIKEKYDTIKPILITEYNNFLNGLESIKK